MMKKMLGLVVFLMLLCDQALPAGVLRPAAFSADTKTRWNVEPSFVLDTVCFLNVLTGDPFYLDYYKDEYAKFQPRITLGARDALADLKRKVKDEKGGIISAFLALNFSVTDDKTLDDMLRTVKDSSKMKARLQKTVYYNEDDWKLYESVREDLTQILTFLKEIRFDQYWKENALPKINKKIAEIRPGLPKYDVVGEVERLLGSDLDTDRITVNILFYSQPHGIRVTGLRFLTDQDYPFEIVLRNAVHEPMHPPFDLKNDKELKEALDLLKGDDFLMDKVNNHDKSFGYNSFDGFVEEDCVQALEQIICEKFGVAVDARTRWKENDNGMHVLAIALYSLMKAENFNGEKEKFRGFLIRNIKNGALAPGKIKLLYTKFYAANILR